MRLLMVPACTAKFSLLMLTGMSVLPSVGLAQIYKYQDAYGKWQFTDKPPQTGEAVEGHSEKFNKKPLQSNVEQTLERKFKLLSAIEKAAAAVVKLQTALGSGSGFFVSQNGFLATNRYVIRPAKLATAAIEKTFAQAENNVRKARKLLASKRAQLAENQRPLTNYVRYFEGLSDSEQTQRRSEYNKKRKFYRSDKQVIARFSEKLKSDATELALLKADGYTSPFIPIAKSKTYHQCHDVFAIGSPLGNTDYMPSGVITSLKRKKIIIDALILPGNRAEPVINARGLVIDINTCKLLSSDSIG